MTSLADVSGGDFHRPKQPEVIPGPFLIAVSNGFAGHFFKHAGDDIEPFHEVGLGHIQRW